MESVPGSGSRETGSSTQGGQVTEQAKQQSQQLAQQARQQASELTNRGSEQVKSQLATQKDQAAERLSPIKTALQETGQQLRNQDQESIAEYLDKAADQVDRFSGYLREREVDEIAEEVRDFARSKPGLFLGGAAVLGFLAARFLKSSSQEAASGGDGSGATPTPTDRAAATYGTEEPATGLLPGAAEREPVREPTEPPRGS